MPELRTDWLTARSVILAENRALRPNEFTGETAATPVAPGAAAAASGLQSIANLTLAEAGLPAVSGVPSCPFCAGNEPHTPPAVYERLDQDGKWQVRVVSNMYPAVMLEGVVTGGPPVAASAGEPPAATAATGAHEVIIESARHVDRTSALSIAELRNVLEAYAGRLRHWRADGRFAYGLIFKNQGPQAGASIAHLHSQFIALAEVPPAVDAELRRAKETYDQHRSCPYCRLIERERSIGARIVLDRDGFIAFCPFASLQPHEVWLLPAHHESAFEDAGSTDRLERLASVLHSLIARMEAIVPNATYNMLLRTAAWKVDCEQWFHWRLELIPRVNAIAGMEIATGIHINPLAPEHAARQLRPI